MATTVTNVVDITADPDDVWAVLAYLPAPRFWLPGVLAAGMDGNVRICSMADGQEIHERIGLSPERRSHRFGHPRGPLPVQRPSRTFTPPQRPSGRFPAAEGTEAGTARVTLRTIFDPADPTATDKVTEMIEGAFRQSL